MRGARFLKYRVGGGLPTRESFKERRAGVWGWLRVLKVGRAWGTKRLEHEAMSHPQISKGWRGDYQGGGTARCPAPTVQGHRLSRSASPLIYLTIRVIWNVI